MTQLCIIKDVERVKDDDTKKTTLKDFHLLPINGQAGINRMTNKNITFRLI